MLAMGRIGNNSGYVYGTRKNFFRDDVEWDLYVAGSYWDCYEKW